MIYRKRVALQLIDHDLALYERSGRSSAIIEFLSPKIQCTKYEEYDDDDHADHRSGTFFVGGSLCV